MNDINQSQLSLFRGVHDTQPRPVTLEGLVTMMRTDQSVRDLTEKHRYARTVGDEQGARRYKHMMASFGVAARFEGGRQQKHIVEYTGLSLVDIDHIPAERMSEVLALVRGDEHTLLAYTTLSGKGIRILARYSFTSGVQESGVKELQTIPQSLENKDSLQDLPNNAASTQSIVTADVNKNCEAASGHLSALLSEAKTPELLNSMRASYPLAFSTINTYYQNLTGLPTDGQCKNIGRISTIAYDENLYYNPEATPFTVTIEEKKPVGRPKKGTKIERVEESVLRELERRGVVYEAGSYNKYVSAACYEMNRYGVPEEQCREWAVNRFADYDAADVASIVRSCYLQTEEHGTARPPKAEKESRYASIKDIQDWLRGNDIRIRHNVITRKREMGTPSNSPSMGRTQPSLQNNLPERPEGAPHRGGAVQRTEGVCWGEALELTDQHVNSLYCRFCLDTGRQAKISDFYIIIESDFYPEYHPLREYLESLPAWNGIDYIDQVASMVHVTGCTQEMHNRFFKQWLVAMVAAWLEPDKTNHEILTYIGPQGIYKSTFVRHLLPTELSGYFSTKNFAGRMTKDDRLELTEMALISLEELDSLQSAELNQLKAITTDPMVNERAAFARYKERRAHIASFCGTGNNPRFLTDLTDNRRWLPFLVRDIDSPWTHPMPYAGMYSQAYTLYRTGFRYWFDADDNAELQRHNRQFEEPCMEEELIATYLRVPYGDEVGEFLTATRIIELIGGAVKRPLSAKKVALCMNRLGFEARRIRNVRGWNVVILTGNDIKEEQRLNAHRSVED